MTAHCSGSAKRRGRAAFLQVNVEESRTKREVSAWSAYRDPTFEPVIAFTPDV